MLAQVPYQELCSSDGQGLHQNDEKRLDKTSTLRAFELSLRALRLGGGITEPRVNKVRASRADFGTKQGTRSAHSGAM